MKSRIYKSEHIFHKKEDAVSYLKLSFLGQEHESFKVMFLDNRNGLISDEELFRGTIDGAAIYPREVVKAAIAFNAAAVIFSHNHPSGNSDPSEADKSITSRLSEALKLIDVRVLDHIVIGENETCSFVEHGLV